MRSEHAAYIALAQQAANRPTYKITHMPFIKRQPRNMIEWILNIIGVF